VVTIEPNSIYDKALLVEFLVDIRRVCMEICFLVGFSIFGLFFIVGLTTGFEFY